MPKIKWAIPGPRYHQFADILSDGPRPVSSTPMDDDSKIQEAGLVIDHHLPGH